MQQSPNSLKRSASEQPVGPFFTVADGWLYIRKSVSIRASSICAVEVNSQRASAVILRTKDGHEYHIMSETPVVISFSPSYVPTPPSVTVKRTITELIVKEHFSANALMEEITQALANN